MQNVMTGDSTDHGWDGEFVRVSERSEGMSEEKHTPSWCDYPNANSTAHAEGCWTLLGSDNKTLSREECGECEFATRKKEAKEIKMPSNHRATRGVRG